MKILRGLVVSGAMLTAALTAGAVGISVLNTPSFPATASALPTAAAVPAP